MKEPILELENRKIYEDGTVILTEDGVKESFYRNPELPKNVLVAMDKKENNVYNNWANIFDFEKLEENIKEQDNTVWFIPAEYEEIKIEDVLLSKCENNIQTCRVLEELILYEERNMMNFLKFLFYMVDIMRKNNIVWGVGRGSSVSSYILYLIGIHKVDSLKYDLDISEFLR